MNNNLKKADWSENVILVDADYVDQVTLNLIANFERMLGRQIPNASMALWADCVALDGGLRPSENQTQVILIHSKNRKGLDHFSPSDFASKLTSQAFKDQLGEFIFTSYPVEEDMVSLGDFFSDALQIIVTQQEVKRVMVIPNAEDGYIYNKVRTILNKLDNEEKHVTIFTMEPMPGGNFRQEILGYSLMAALGIKSDEINQKD